MIRDILSDAHAQQSQELHLCRVHFVLKLQDQKNTDSEGGGGALPKDTLLWKIFVTSRLTTKQG